MAVTSDKTGLAIARLWWPVVALVAAIALGMRVIGAQESPAGDELYFLEIIRKHSLGSMLHAVIHQEKTPPLGFVLGWASAKAGTPDIWMRAPSVIAGTALVPVCAMLARRVFTPAAGVAAALFAAFSPFLLFYGIESRSYALAALFTALSALLLLRVLAEGGRARWALWALTVLAALLSHYTAVFAIAAQIAWALWTQRDRRRELAGWTACVIIVFAAWLPFFFVQFGHAGDEARRIAISSPLDLDTVTGIAGRALAGHPLGATSGAVSYSKVPGLPGLYLIVAGLLIALLAAAWRRGLQGKSQARPHSGATLMLAMALSVPAGLIASSLIPDRSLLLSRNLITALPAVIVLVAALTTRRPRPTAVLATALITGGLALGSLRELADYPRPAMREAAKALEQRFKPGDVILEAMYFSGPPLDRDLALHLTPRERAALLLTRDAGLRPFDALLPAGASVFTVTPGAGYSTGVLAPAGASADRYRLVWSKRFAGYTPIYVGQWQRITKAR